jgi:hypothetical protein
MIKMPYAFLIFAIHATFPAHLIPFGLIILIIFCEAYKLWSSLFYICLQPPVTFSLLGPNILLTGLLSYTLNLYSSFNKRDRVLHS